MNKFRIAQAYNILKAQTCSEHSIQLQSSPVEDKESK